MTPANERNYPIEEKEDGVELQAGTEEDELVYEGMSGDGETSGPQMLGFTKLSDGASTQPPLAEKYGGDPITQ